MNFSRLHIAIATLCLLLAACGADHMLQVEDNSGGSAVQTTSGSGGMISENSQASVVSSKAYSAVLLTNPISIEGHESPQMHAEDPFLVLGMDKVDLLFDK